ncbi:cytochrome P450 4c3 [Nephila pilipes]|uniref:Cytochrome P450 4c3 n=1 Tax=Nephila pilipes TaxID=299642 RepID=A0A8X6MUE5_NEPPI|nr:cytochrome P450 4c3 [Nephila pilipes]
MQIEAPLPSERVVPSAPFTITGIDFAGPGHDTTSVGMSWCLWLVGLHPWVQDNIRNELDDIFGDDERDITMEDLKNMKYLESVIKVCFATFPVKKKLN